MASLTSFELTTIVVVAALGAGSAGLLIYLMRRLRERRAQLLHELRESPDVVADRAYNRIAMARREVEIVARQGTDVRRARELVAEAQASFDGRHHEQAYRSAQLAHETLVRARRGTPSEPSSSSTQPSQDAAGPSKPTRPPTPVIPPRSASPATSGPTSPTGLDLSRNRAQSQFELRLLDRDLETARRERPTAAQTQEASRLREDAAAAFDRDDFTEAFRAALKGRRALGGTVEALSAPRDRALGSAAGAPLPGAAADDPSSALAATSGERCPQCGHPLLVGDAICRGCGASRTPTTCPACGAARLATDTFCGRCGARYDRPTG